MEKENRQMTKVKRYLKYVKSTKRTSENQQEKKQWLSEKNEQCLYQAIYERGIPQRHKKWYSNSLRHREMKIKSCNMVVHLIDWQPHELLVGVWSGVVVLERIWQVQFTLGERAVSILRSNLDFAY